MRAEIVRIHDEAVAKYAAAVTQLDGFVADMVAAERAWKHVAVHLMNENGSGSGFPRRGLRVLEDIRETGVRVPASASRLADPKVAAEYGESYERFWYLPRWADPQTLGFADQQVAAIVDGLRDAGIDADPFTPYAPPAPQPQLKVRVIRGVIQAAPKVQRDPETGRVISSEVVEFREGDDVMLDESEARVLQRGRLVAVHGEDPMPEPKPQGATVDVDGSLPKDERNRHAWTPEPRQEYAGHHHNMDLSAYPD
jgi:hypothetical protein